MNHTQTPNAPDALPSDDATLPPPARATLPDPSAPSTRPSARQTLSAPSLPPSPGAIAPTLTCAGDPPDPSDQTLDSGQHLKAPPSPHAAPTAPSLLPVDASYYERGDELARGGMGRILLARDRRLQRPVAIKELLSGGERARLRFEREAFITARLQHPSVVNVYEAGCWPSGEPFYTMEKVNGRPLEDVIADARTLQARLALLPHLIDVAEAMAYAHSQHVIHRDLKPANVLVGSFGETVVIDWGLAKVIGEADEASPEVTPALDALDNLTVAGAVMGTPAFMPPEQAHGQGVDARADVYAIGAMLYHLLSGQTPFQGQTSRQILISLVGHAPPSPLAALCPDAPPELLSVVARAMHPDPDARYPDAGALASDLRGFQTGRMVAAHHYSAADLMRRWWRRHKPLILITCAAALALAALGAYSVHHVMRARDEAQAQRDAAEARRLDALAARLRAEALSNDAVIAQARALLPTDPTAALAWLKRLNPDTPRGWPQARALTADISARGVARHVLRGHAGLVARLALTPGDRALLSSASDGTMRRWTLSDGASLTFSHPHGLAPHFALSADAQRAATLTLQGQPVVLDLSRPGVIDPVPLPNASPLLSFSPASPDLLAVASADGQVGLYRARDKALHLVALPGLPAGAAIDALRFRPNGDLVASAGSLSWRVDPSTRAASSLPPSGEGAASDLTYAPDDAWAVRLNTQAPPTLLRCAPNAPCAPTLPLPLPPAPASAAHFSPDSRWLALAYPPTPTSPASLRLFDLRRLDPAAPPSGPDVTLTSAAADAFRHLRFDSGGRFLAAAGAAGAEVWDLSRPSAYALALRLPDALTATFSTASPLLLTSHLDQTIRIHHLPLPSAPTLVPPPAAVRTPLRAAFFDPRAGGLLLLDADGTLWDPQGQPAAAPPASTTLLSPDGPLFASFQPQDRALLLTPARDPARAIRLPLPADDDQAPLNAKGNDPQNGAAASQGDAFALGAPSETSAPSEPYEPDAPGAPTAPSAPSAPSPPITPPKPTTVASADAAAPAQADFSDTIDLKPPAKTDPLPPQAPAQAAAQAPPQAPATATETAALATEAAEAAADRAPLRDAAKSKDATKGEAKSSEQAAASPPSPSPPQARAQDNRRSSGKKANTRPIGAGGGGNSGTGGGGTGGAGGGGTDSAGGDGALGDLFGSLMGQDAYAASGTTDADPAPPPVYPAPPSDTAETTGTDEAPETTVLAPPSSVSDNRPGAPTNTSTPATATRYEDLSSNPAATRDVIHPDLSRSHADAHAALLAWAPSPAGPHLFAVSDDLQTLWRWDPRAPAPPAQAHLGAESTTRAFAAAPDGSLFVSAGLGALLRFGADLAPLSPLACDGVTPLRLTLSPDGAALAAVIGPGRARIWRLDTGAFTDLHTARLDALLLHLTFSPDGATLAAADDAGDLHLWSLALPASPPTYRTWRAHPSPALAVGWLPPAGDPSGPAALTSVAADGVVARWQDETPASPADLRALWDRLSPVTLDADQQPSSSPL